MRIFQCSKAGVLLAGVIAIVASRPCVAENWPGFRGPGGQGVSVEKDLPLTWSLATNLAWRVRDLGLGWSSPIVWEDRVFVTSASPDGTSCHLVCVNAVKGDMVWDKALFTQDPPRKLAENSHATPTPVTDGKLVYAAFNGGRIVATDWSGNVVWSWRDREFVSKHGLSASPILYGDLLIMPFDGNGPADVNNIGYLTAWDGAFIAALDKRTGQEMWRAKRGLSRQAHVTPMLAEVNGRTQLISGAGDVVQGFDASSGTLIWSVQSRGEGVVPAIVCGEGLVFASSGYGAPTLRAIRPDGQGEVTATHIAWKVCARHLPPLLGAGFSSVPRTRSFAFGVLPPTEVRWAIPGATTQNPFTSDGSEGLDFDAIQRGRRGGEDWQRLTFRPGNALGDLRHLWKRRIEDSFWGGFDRPAAPAGPTRQKKHAELHFVTHFCFPSHFCWPATMSLQMLFSKIATRCCCSGVLAAAWACSSSLAHPAMRPTVPRYFHAMSSVW